MASDDLKRRVRKGLRRVATALGVTALSTRNVPFGFDWLLDVKRLSALWDLDTSTFFDVGANDGSVALRIRESFPLARIVCFEPHPDVFRTLRRRGVENNFVCHEMALANADGEATLYAPEYDKLSSLLPNAPSTAPGTRMKAFTVRVTTLDMFAEAENASDRIGVLKVDTEGGDLEVLRGAHGMFARSAIDFVYVEFSSVVTTSGMDHGALSPLAAYLQSQGLDFIASYTEQVAQKRQYCLVSNALFARTPDACHMSEQ